MKRIILFLSLMVVMTMPGQIASAQTVLTDVWKDKDHHTPLKKIAVFWMAKVPQNRLLAENEFVHQLKVRGITAMPVYVVIPPDKLVERDVALTKIRDLGADAVLILRLADKLTVQSPIPQPGSAGPSRLSDYYQYVYDAPARDESELAYLETNLFDVKTERRIWTARSVSKIDVVNQEVVSDFIRLMIDRLASDGMIP
jgi:hypothetical protein